MTDVRPIPLTLLDGSATTLGEVAGDGPVLVVNVASRCGLTPQYAALEELARTYGPRGLTVLGAPCNQFLGQEPGSNEEIAEFCSMTYGVTFPLTDKVEVNGEGRHPLFAQLTAAADAEGHTGDVRWNFEKWLVSRDGEVVARFAPITKPDAAEVVAAVEASLEA
ncbi:glutathione peroxidase [Longivirga aurantiaca]|uniref:Glutathione peroxidase n=1 Tax=Longivirga aurantiaca TaxID=1837743 RepID=A0ABW1SXH9_9ACTN